MKWRAFVIEASSLNRNSVEAVEIERGIQSLSVILRELVPFREEPFALDGVQFRRNYQSSDTCANKN